MTFTSASIVVCSYNGGSRILKMLPYLANQLNGNNSIILEVVVVDNGSDVPFAPSIISEWHSLGNPFPMYNFYQGNKGKANALEMGYDNASNEIIITVDDDNWLAPNFVEVVLECFNAIHNIGVLGGYGIETAPSEELPAWFEDFRRSFVCQPMTGRLTQDIERSLRWAAGSSIRRDMWLYLKSNGFSFLNSRVAGKPQGEDVELLDAICLTGHHQYTDNRLWFYHDIGDRISLESIRDQAVIAGRAAVAPSIIREIHRTKERKKPLSFDAVFKTLNEEFNSKRLNSFRHMSLYSLYRHLLGKRKFLKGIKLEMAKLYLDNAKEEMNNKNITYSEYYKSIIQLAEKTFNKKPLD